MADTHEKKAQKKVVKHGEPNKPAQTSHKEATPEHKAVQPAPKAPEHAHEPARKEAPPVKKVEATVKERHEAAPSGRGERSSPAGPAPKVEPKPSPKAEEKPAAKPEAPKKDAPEADEPVEPTSPSTTSEAVQGQAGRGQSVPAEAAPAGEAEGEIVEEPGETKKGEKPRKKKGKKERKPHIKPVLTDEVVKAMALRRALKDKTPDFIRQEAYNYGRLGQNWRKPRGTHSKMRHHINYRINVVSIGYGGPNLSKGLHPSGFREVLVHHPMDLDKVDPATQAARIAGGVGSRKRLMIQQRAQRKGIRVLNEMQE